LAKKRKKNKEASRKNQPKSLVEFKQRLWGRKPYNPKKVFRDLHKYRDFQEVRVAAKYVENQKTSLSHFIFGTPFAKSYQEICSLNFFAYTDDLKRDLDWMSLSVERYAKEISSFVIHNLSFQKTFLMGDYEEASSILESIISEFGPSLWSLEKGLLLAEKSNGLESNKKLMSQITGDKANNIILRFLAELMSLRCETKLSDENYKMRLTRALDLGEDYDQFKSYCHYRLEHLHMDIIPVATAVTYYEGTSSIIDRYLTFISILQSCAVANSEYHNIASDIIHRVDGLIQDSRIDALAQFFSPERVLTWNSLATDVISILDNYTDGNYEKSSTTTGKFLLENPEIFELYYIYIRSLDQMGKPFIQLFPQDSVAASILEHSNVVLRGEKTWRNSSDYLAKLSTSLWRDPLAYRIYNFYIQETLPSPEKRFYKLALLNALPFNPRFATIYDDSHKAKILLDQISCTVGEGSTLSLIRGIAVGSQREEIYEFPQSIPKIRRQIYSAKIYEANAKPDHAISILEPIYRSITKDKLPCCVHTRDRVTRILFRCYLDTMKLSECTDMVVHSFMRNELSTRRISFDLLVKSIDETTPPDTMRKITYPILYSIVNTEARTVYVAYDNFLNSLGVNRPTQLFDIKDQFHTKELNEFLFRVCKIDVLACSYHFCGTKDLEKERIRICQFLSERDQANLKAYSDEISTITSRSLIRQGIRQIHVSKIHVDDVGIRATGRKLLEESFERYRELASMSSIETIQMLDLESIHFYDLTEDGELVKKPISKLEFENIITDKKIVGNSLFLNFRELFIDVRDRFISSGEHGLDGYLSVRIRHGVLQNQIRSPFEALYLISEKDTTTMEYLINSYWDTQLKGATDEDKSTIQSLLAKFSSEIDEVSQKLNKEMIQVRTEKKNPSGLFNYEFSSLELYKMFEDEFLNIKDFDQFLDSILRVLWVRTQKNLENIREIISTQIKDTIYDSISRLEQDVRKSIASNQAAELRKNITSCQTKLQHTLESIEQWFTISRSSVIPEFSIVDLVNICVESINNIYPHKKVKPHTKFEGEVIIDGKFFTPFFDIVRTLLDNVIVHSGVSPEEMNIVIETKVAKDRLTIKIKNSLGEEIRRSNPVDSLKKTHSLVNISEIVGVIASEGRSGLIKVQKIMRIDLQRNDSMLDFAYDEDSKFVVTLRMEMEGLRKCES
jgi:hypothetical protein